MRAPDNAAIIADLARAKAAFQLRALTAIIAPETPTTVNPSAVAPSAGEASMRVSPAVFRPFHAKPTSPEA